MSRGREKIDTEGGESLGSTPFAAFDASALPNAPRSIQSGREVPEPKRPDRKRGRVELKRVKSGRAGKTVTVVEEFAPHVPMVELEALVQRLKKACACGGTLKDRAIELQGDVRDRAAELLEAEGFRPVRSGG